MISHFFSRSQNNEHISLFIEKREAENRAGQFSIFCLSRPVGRPSGRPAGIPNSLLDLKDWSVDQLAPQLSVRSQRLGRSTAQLTDWYL